MTKRVFSSPANPDGEGDVRSADLGILGDGEHPPAQPLAVPHGIPRDQEGQPAPPSFGRLAQREVAMTIQDAKLSAVGLIRCGRQRDRQDLGRRPVTGAPQEQTATAGDRLGRDASRQVEFRFESPSRQVFGADLVAQKGQLAAAEQESGSRNAKPRRSKRPFEQIGDRVGDPHAGSGCGRCGRLCQPPARAQPGTSRTHQLETGLGLPPAMIDNEQIVALLPAPAQDRQNMPTARPCGKRRRYVQ